MTLLAPYVAFALQIGTGAALVAAGSTKLAEPAPLQRVVHALGLPWPTRAASLLATCELATGLALAMLPASWLTASLVALLGVTFAIGAGLAIWRGLQVECACFGSALSARLGWRQLSLLPIWLLVASSVIAEPAMFVPQRLAIAFGMV